MQRVLTGSQVTLCERTTDVTAPPAADDPVIQLAPAEHPLTAPAGPQLAATPCLALGLPGGVAGWPRPAAPLDRARLELPQLAGLSRPGPHLRGRGRSPLPGPGPAVWFLCSDGRHKVGADIRPERPLPRAANRLPSQDPPQVHPAATWARSLSRLPSASCFSPGICQAVGGRAGRRLGLGRGEGRLLPMDSAVQAPAVGPVLPAKPQAQWGISENLWEPLHAGQPPT